jgi:single-stranded-DNA-specific exonuclease
VSAWRFDIPDCPPDDVRRLQGELGISGPLSQVLVRRGLADPGSAREFLSGGEEHPPEAFAGIQEAAELILSHVRDGSRITVHGDYDVDGICSTAILLRVLRGLGGDVDSYIPDRAGDGYGLAQATVDRLAERGTRLLITADCAITAVQEVASAREQGIDVVVTDHHTPRADGILPDAPIVHPGVSGYPFRDLCAAAVAYKLAQHLCTRAGTDPRSVRADLDLVALATIADVVPLVGENRVLVRSGLRALAGTSKPGLRALMAVAGVDPGKITERSIGFALAPRLNAAGRLYRADAGLELVMSTDPARAQEIARELDRANSERRQVEMRIRVAAEAQMRELGDRPAYVLAGEGWHAGVIGIVASRLVESSGRPVVMIALDGDRGRGSGRSIDAVNLLEALTSCQEHLARYGGHAAAAGLEIERRCLPAFTRGLEEHVLARLKAGDPVPVERVDAVVAGEELGMDLAEELAMMAPFGRGNPSVSLMVDEACFADPRPMGEGKHVRFTVESGGSRARAVAFGNGGRLPVAAGEPALATFSLEVNEWNGVSEPRLVLRRACPAADPEPTEPLAAEEGDSGSGELVLFALP